MRRGSTLLAAALAAGAALAACTDTSGWHSHSLAGLMPALAFDMTDDSGRAVSARTYRDRTVLLYFGYASCPDECPTTLARLAQALERTKDRGAGSAVLFVTVDPERDTLARLHEYAQSFGAQFVGLRGTPQQLEALTKRYRVGYSRGVPDAKGDYEVTHGTGVFVFDGTGRSRLLVLPRDSTANITADLDRLAAGIAG